MSLVQDRPQIPGALFGAGNDFETSSMQQPPADFESLPLAGDSFGYVIPPPGAGTQGCSGLQGTGLQGMLQQLMAMLQQLLGGTQGGFQNDSPQQYFQNADGTSLGDPHLNFNGTNGRGSTEQAQFDSMSAHSDLLDSDSFAGGYRLSTTPTTPNANGVTYNQRATVTTNFGNTQVCMDRDSGASIVQNGQTSQMAVGESYDLGNGETALLGRDGTLSVTQTNASGGSVTTTMRQNGNGVDVRTHAHDVSLGGDLAEAAEHSRAPRRPQPWGEGAEIRRRALMNPLPD